MGKISLTGATTMVLLAALVAALAIVAVAGQEAGAAPRQSPEDAVPATISPEAMSGDVAAQQRLYRYAEGT